MRAEATVYRRVVSRAVVATGVVVSLCAACGANVRANIDASADGSLPDAVIAPIEGCPASAEGGLGRWETVALPEGFSRRAMAKVVAFDRSFAVIGGDGEREPVRDHWLFDARAQRWTRLEGAAGVRDTSRNLRAVWMPEARELFVWFALEWGNTRRGVRVALDGTVRELPVENAPRTLVSSAVSVAGMVFVAGSVTEGDHNEFALYDPRADRWETVLAPREQNARGSFSLVANERSVLIWGGADATFDTAPARNDGWRFDAVARRWSSITRTGAASARFGHEGLWIGDSMWVWGGTNGSRSARSGGRYFEGPDAWLPVSELGAPASVENVGSFSSWAQWTGSDVFVWTLDGAGEARAGRWDPRSSRWFAAAAPAAQQAALRADSSSVWVDCALYVVGGRRAFRSEFAGEMLRWAP